MKPGNSARICRASCSRKGALAEREQAAERVVARQHLHRHPEPGIRRAEHQEPRVGVREPSRPQLVVNELQRADDETAARVREDANRLAVGFAIRRAPPSTTSRSRPLRPGSAAASRRQTRSPRGSATGTWTGRRRSLRPGRRLRRSADLSASAAERFGAFQFSQTRPCSSLRWLPKIPGTMNTAGSVGLRLASVSRRARRPPTNSSPEDERGPIGRKSAGAVSINALTMAPAVWRIGEVGEVRDLAAAIEHERRLRPRAACRRTSTASARRDRCRSSRTRRRAASSATT